MFVLNEFCYAKVYHIQKSSNLEENIVLIYFEHSVGTGFQAYFTYFGDSKIKGQYCEITDYLKDRSNSIFATSLPKEEIEIIDSIEKSGKFWYLSIGEIEECLKKIEAAQKK